MVYDSIKTCPIVNFQKCITDDDFTGLLINPKKKYKGDLHVVFKNLNDQLIDTFGIGVKNEKVFWLKHAIVTHKAEYLRTENSYHLNKYKGLEIDLSLIEKDEPPVDIARVFSSNHRELSKWSGRDSRTLTVFEYYNDFNDSQRGKDS